MSFTWPIALLGLLAVPALALAYVLQLRRRRKNAVRFSNVALVRAALPARSRWRRHVPVGLLLLAIASLGLAAARPRVNQTVPLGRTSIILTLDVSRSMCSTDVQPNRLTAAQAAARAFVAEQPKGTRIGLVAFSGFAEEVVRPTTSKSELTHAIDSLTTGRGTVIGAALLKSLDAIAEVNPNVKPVDTTGASSTTPTSDPNAGTGSATTSTSSATPGKPAGGGDYQPDVVVLLTDGANTRGVPPVDAAQQAVDRKVRVYTIGFGTTDPSPIVCTREQLGSDVFGQDPGGGGFPAPGAGGGGGGGRRFQQIDEATLQKVADMTGGQYYRAGDAQQLGKVFSSLPKQVVLQHERHEISTWFVASGILLALAAVGLSLAWNRSP
jgi:Ca-activated chloride channel family protein